MTEPELVRERRGAVSVLRINRPEARNALNGEVIAGLAEGILEAEASAEIRAVVLTGTGDRTFSAGLDLREFAEQGADGGGMRAALDTFKRLQDGEVTVPIVGAANGTAVAGGMEMLLGCDVVVASTECRFGLPEVKRGLFSGGSGTTLGTRIPLAVALELTLTGDLIDAGRAYDLGLVNRVVPPADVLDTALDLAQRIAANGPLGVAATKELVRLWARDPAAAAVRRDHWREVVFNSDDAREGSLAFVEKRDPVWRGR
jgi:enoyl-CoA hydratase/carnithine racemase